MASSDSQAKTIALVIFIILSIGTSCLAYFFHEKTDQLAQQAAASKDAASKSDQAAKTAKERYQELRERVFGNQAQDDHDKVKGLIDQDLQRPKLGPQRLGRKQTYQHYSDAAAYLHNELNEADRRIASLEQKNGELENQVKALKAQYDQEVAKARDAQNAKTQELAAETRKFQDLINIKEQENEQLRDQLSQKQDETQQIRRDLEKMTKEFDQRVKERDLIIEQVRTQLTKSDQVKFESADGQITYVSESGAEAYINLGQDDGVYHGLTFGVYGRDSGGNPYDLPKASLEVYRIIGPHRSLAKISQNPITQAIVPGDLIFNPVWNRGDKESIAFVGYVHLNDDREDDNNEFIRLIEEHGGRVDAWIDTKTGKLMGGPISVRTKWLVVGDLPEPGDSKLPIEEARLYAQIRSNADILRKQAKERGVHEINIRNFITYMGYNKPQQTVQTGSEGRVLFGKGRPRLVDKLEPKWKKAANSKPSLPPASSTAAPAPSNP